MNATMNPGRTASSQQDAEDTQIMGEWPKEPRRRPTAPVQSASRSYKWLAAALGGLAICTLSWLGYQRWGKSTVGLPDVAGVALLANAAGDNTAAAEPKRVDPPAAPLDVTTAPPQAAVALKVGAVELPPDVREETVGGSASPTADTSSVGTDLKPPTDAGAAAQVAVNAGFASAITQLQADVTDLKTKLAARSTSAAGSSASAGAVVGVGDGVPRPMRRTRVARATPNTPTTAPVAPTPAAATGTVLAVDLWDGRPSVVVGTGVVSDRRVQFLAEGDRKGRVTLKEADVGRQEAVFDVQGQEARLRSEAATAR